MSFLVFLILQQVILCGITFYVYFIPTLYLTNSQTSPQTYSHMNHTTQNRHN